MFTLAFVMSISCQTLSQSGISISQTSELSVCVYDEIIHAILTITNKLDLSTKDEDPDDASTTDPLKNLTPTTPKDFIVFVNMVEFCRSVSTRYMEKFVNFRASIAITIKFWNHF